MDNIESPNKDEHAMLSVLYQIRILKYDLSFFSMYNLLEYEDDESNVLNKQIMTYKVGAHTAIRNMKANAIFYHNTIIRSSTGVTSPTEG